MLTKILQGILKGKNVVYKDGYDIRTSFSYGTDVRIYRARIESKDCMLRALAVKADIHTGADCNKSTEIEILRRSEKSSLRHKEYYYRNEDWL